MNAILILILAAIVLLAVKGSVSHFKGEGSCCGGGGDGIKKIRPKKLERVADTRTLTIHGMVCDNCAARIHNALNSIDGINAKVSRSKSRAVIKSENMIDDEMIEKVITDLGYTLSQIIK